MTLRVRDSSTLFLISARQLNCECREKRYNLSTLRGLVWRALHVYVDLQKHTTKDTRHSSHDDMKEKS